MSKIKYRFTISIHAPREGGDALGTWGFATNSISIHAPREGGDSDSDATMVDCETFQSTPPARGATLLSDDVVNTRSISIHAPREGGD